MVREAFQLGMKIWLGDLKGRWFENLMEYALIVYSGLLLLWEFDGMENPDAKIVKGDFAGFVVALAWLECIITIGRHPWFRTWNIYILMVFTVFCEFGKILFYYSFFIITAGLGFYVHLHSRYISYINVQSHNFQFCFLQFGYLFLQNESKSL